MRSITHTQAGLRALVLGLLLVLLVGLFLWLFEDQAVSSAPPQVHSVVVQSGDTLWDIADQLAPQSADLRVVVRELVAFNGLQSKVLQPGQVLEVPLANTPRSADSDPISASAVSAISR